MVGTVSSRGVTDCRAAFAIAACTRATNASPFAREGTDYFRLRQRHGLRGQLPYLKFCLLACPYTGVTLDVSVEGKGTI
jgi:hypothetical protein